MKKRFFTSETQRHIIAFVITALFHIGILFIVLPEHLILAPTPIDLYETPVQFVMKEVKVSSKPKPKPTPNKTQEQQIEKKTETPSTSKKVAKKIVAPTEPTKPTEAPKPTRLPGDRDLAEVILASQKSPIVPKEALNYNWHGSVKIEFTIDVNGSVSKYHIISSSGHDILDTTFAKTVQSYWKFKPKRVLGKNKVSKLQISYTFPKLQ